MAKIEINIDDEKLKIGINLNNNTKNIQAQQINDIKVLKQANNTMSKSKAKVLLSQKGYICPYKAITFASKNNTAYNYWANPGFAILDENWYLVLNDWISKKLFVFKIPQYSIKYSDLKARSDKKCLIDLQIIYNDPNFTDSRSGISFRKYLVDVINY